MKILVTGANGFVGKSVAKELGGRGNEISVLVRARRPAEPFEHEVISADLTREDELCNSLAGRSFDAVVDIAGKVIGTKSAGPTDDYLENIICTRNLLEALRDKPPSRFLKVSTADVYEVDGMEGKITESTPVCPRNYYSLSKFAGEEWCRLWASQTKTPLCVARLTQIFGPDDSSSKFIPSMIRQIKKLGKVTVAGDGTEVRDYLYIDDLAVLLAECVERAASGVLNLASGQSVPLNDVVVMLREICERDVVVQYGPRKKAKTDLRFDVARLAQTIPGMHFTPLLNSLKITYDAFL